MRLDNRAQAIGISQMLLGLLVGAVLFWILSAVTGPLFKFAGNASSDPVANQGTTYLQQGVEFFPIAVLFLSFFGLISYAVFTRGVMR